MPASIPDILQSIRCERKQNDRRRSPRVGMRTRVSVRATDLTEHEGWMRDICEDGAGLLLNADMPARQNVVLRVEAAGERAMDVQCRVVHSMRVGSLYRVGVEFLDKPWKDRLENASEIDQFNALKAYLRRLKLAVID